MRRALVLTDETARHPFRMSLPPYVRKIEESVSKERSWRLTSRDAREFLMAYSACFVCVTAFFS